MEDYTITDKIMDYEYNNYYSEETDWEKENEIWAEKEDLALDEY